MRSQELGDDGGIDRETQESRGGCLLRVGNPSFVTCVLKEMDEFRSHACIQSSVQTPVSQASFAFSSLFI